MLKLFSSNLVQRILSACVMLPVAASAVWMGGTLWAVFLGIISVAALWEWWRLTRPFALWQALAGVPYIGCSMVALWLIRNNPQPFGPDSTHGVANVMQIILLLMCIDIGAYIAGKAIGGPKLAPRVSPGKTWAGLAGGMMSAALLLWMMSAERPIRLVLIGYGIAILAQAGDLFESWLKRRAGVKDSSNLIPGHGGVLDRMDGYLTAVPVIWLLLHFGKIL
jgi:phosphatidate cytidylyltransferase